MAFVIPTAWVSNQAYSEGDRVSFNGVTYEALADVTSTTNPSQDGTNWNVIAVTKIQDYNSLVEAVRLELNENTSVELTESVPMFINNTETDLKLTFSVPAQIKTNVQLTVDDEGRVEMPADLLEIRNIRLANDTPANIYGVRERQTLEFYNVTKESYEEVRQTDDNGFFNINEFDSPVYFYDGQYAWIAPMYDAGTVIEITYIAELIPLGTTIFRTRNGEPINSAGQTVAEWVAAGNAANTFVQATVTQTNNWFLSVLPELLLYGACTRAERFLRDREQVQIYKEKYQEAQNRLQFFVQKFEDKQHHYHSLESPFFSY